MEVLAALQLQNDERLIQISVIKQMLSALLDFHGGKMSGNEYLLHTGFHLTCFFPARRDSSCLKMRVRFPVCGSSVI